MYIICKEEERILNTSINKYIRNIVVVLALVMAVAAFASCEGKNIGDLFATPTPKVGEMGDQNTYAPMGQESKDNNGITYVSNGNGTCTVVSIELSDKTTKLTIPSYSPDGDQVTVLSPRILENQTNLKKVVLPKGLYTISEYAFAGCTNLSEVNIPDTVISIEQFAFSECISVKSVRLGETLKVIGPSAFKDCNGLTKVSVPANVESLGKECFAFCENLIEIEFNCKAQPDYTMILGCGNLHTLTLNMTSPVLLDSFAYNTTIKKVVLGDNILSVEESAFAGCHAIEEIIVGKNVELLDNNCFYECDALKKVVFEGNSLVSTGVGAFAYCVSLEEFEFPEGVESIGPKCFAGDLKLKKVHIPKAVTFVGEGAFSFCDSLIDVTYSGTEGEWKNLSIRDGNDFLINAKVSFIVK